MIVQSFLRSSFTKRPRFLFMLRLVCLLLLAALSCKAQTTNTNISVVTYRAFTNSFLQNFRPSQFNTSSVPITLTNLGSGLFTVGNLNVTSNLMALHVGGIPNNPPLISLAAANFPAGTVALMAPGSTDQDCAVSLVVGTGSSVAGDWYTITYTTPFTNSPFPIITMATTNGIGINTCLHGYSSAGFTVYSTNILTTGMTINLNFHSGGL